MGNTAAINTLNRDFNSVVVPSGLVAGPSTNNTTANGKRKFGSNGTTIEIEANDLLKQQQNFISRTPLTVKSDDRSDSYRSTDDPPSEPTEGQLRREGMADCEFECSQISKYLYVGGIRVAENLELLKSKNITRIINCASSVIPNHFMNDFKYLSLNLVDGRGEDISWFVCEVIQFIFEGANEGQKTLLHCEKGISRSCSFAIAYRMWSTGEKWKTAFEYIQKRRKISNPHSVFVCNLIEIGEILAGGAAEATLLFRCSYHAAYDHKTAVLKVCRNLNSRRLLVPATSLLNPKGVYILRAVRANIHYLFVWCGRLTSENTIDQAIYLANLMMRIFTNAPNIVRINEGKETEEFLSFLMKDCPFKLPDDASASFDDFYDFPPSEEQIEAAQFTIANQRENQYVANVLSNIGMRTNSTVADNSSADLAQRNASIPPVSHANRLNSNNGEMTPRSRSTSRERPSLRNPKPIVGTIVTATSGSANIAGRAMEPEPVSINLPATLSRKNSFRNEDGSMNRQEFLDRINTIITSADVGSASTSKRFSNSPEEIRPSGVMSDRQTNQPINVVPLKSQNVPSQKENAISAPTLTTAPPNTNNFKNAPANNSYSNVPAMQSMPNGNNYTTNTGSVISNPVPSIQCINYQYQPHPPSSSKPLQMNLASLSSNVSNVATNSPATTQGVYQNNNIYQPNGNSYNGNGNSVVPLNVGQVTNNQYNAAPLGLFHPTNPVNIPPNNNPNTNPNTKKKVDSMKLSLPPISARSGNESARDDRPSPTGPPQTKPHSTSSNPVSNMNFYMNNPNGGYHTNPDEFNVLSPPTPTDGLSRNPSKTKIMAASAEINFNPSRPTSAERKSFGVSPRVAPYLNTDKAHIGAASPIKQSNNVGNLSARPVVSLNLSAAVNGAGNLGMNGYPANNGQAVFQPTPPSTRRPDSDRSVHHPVDPNAYYQQVGVVNQNSYPQNYGGGGYPIAYQQSYAMSQGANMNIMPNQVGVALPNLMMPNVQQNPVPLLNLPNVNANNQIPQSNQNKPILFQLHKKGTPDNSSHGGNQGGEQYEWRAMGIYDDGDLVETEMLFLLCPNNAHHLWIGNEFDFHESGIEIDDQNRPIMSRLLKWLARVGSGEIKNKAIVGTAFLSMDLSIHLSGEETDDFWDSFNDGF